MVSVKQIVFPNLIFAAVVFSTQGQNPIPRRGTVRLVRNGRYFSSYSSGRVQIYLTRWGHICDDADFGLREAHVICHQQGYTGASSHSKASSDRFGFNTAYRIILENVYCSTSNYLTILQCRHSTVISSSCVHGSDDVSVTCYTTRIWSTPYDGAIRLQNSLYTNQGLVEVYCNGQWGTVCNDGFGLTAANTVCRQLGYTGAARYNSLTFQGSSTQPIWFNNVFCFTNYSCIRSCQLCPNTRIRNCGHNKDITIECEYASVSSSTTQTTTCTTSTTSYATPSGASPVLGSIAGVAVPCFICILIPICIFLCARSSSDSSGRSSTNRRSAATKVATRSASPPTAAIGVFVISAEYV